ncbi:MULTISPECIES: HEPN domain-containing protein [Enterobacteriaceae]|uniref:HEPN domain-containing protein n=1 Tax=Enterobacteriaceae TaxID=543 RepID=UPI0015EFDAEE|nr:MULTISPECIES: HEPN domain-containing protein [Enterobacteriaceae]QMI06350.1 hypothetical protein HVY19_16435 [Citrobacter sp. RHB25-C09]URL26629.1 hypothetical protein JZY03_16995 [Enterobacter kobei]
MSYQVHIDSLTQMANDLSKTKDDLERKFLAPYFNDPLVEPETFKLDVKSYCVLLHAAIEDFIEGVVLSVYKASHDLFLEDGVITIPFMYSLHLSGVLERRLSEIADDDVEISKGEVLYPVSPIEYFLNSNYTCEPFIHSMLTSNHGISRKYIKKIVMVLGIHVDFSDVMYSDWKSIAEYRGAYAHSDISYIDKTKAKKPLSPEKCRDAGNSAISFSYKLVEWAKESLMKEYKNSVSSLIIKNNEKKEVRVKNEKLKEEEEKNNNKKKEEEKEKKEHEKEKARLINIERTKKLDILLEWAQKKHPEVYHDIFGET